MTRVSLPTTLDELWDVLDREPEAALYAGGTDLLVKLRSGLTAPSCLICLERVSELAGVREHGDEVFIAAGTTHSRLLEEPLVREHFPVLAKAIHVLGSPPIRHMGTIGGNIVNASPAGDTLPPLHVLEAEVEIRSRNEQRRVSLRHFIVGPGQVSLRRGEIVSGVWVRKVPDFTIQYYEKVGRRKSQACSIAGMAGLLKLSQAGDIEEARLAWGSVGPVVVRSAEVEAALVGKPLCLETLLNAAPLVEAAVSPIDDVRASAAYRRIVAGRLLLRLCGGNDVPQCGACGRPH